MAAYLKDKYGKDAVRGVYRSDGDYFTGYKWDRVKQDFVQSTPPHHYPSCQTRKESFISNNPGVG